MAITRGTGTYVSSGVDKRGAGPSQLMYFGAPPLNLFVLVPNRKAFASLTLLTS